MNGNTGTRLILDQIIEVLQQIDGDTYKQPLSLFSGASFGQHFRHIFEFYECLVKGSDIRKIDYALRKRNPLVEQDVHAAMTAFHQLKEPISSLDESRQLIVVSEYSTSSNENRMLVNSSVGRELMYAYDHAIHHLAIIRMGLQTNCPQVSIPSDLGVAPSTVKYREGIARHGS